MAKRSDKPEVKADVANHPFLSEFNRRSSDLGGGTISGSPDGATPAEPSPDPVQTPFGTVDENPESVSPFEDGQQLQVRSNLSPVDEESLLLSQTLTQLSEERLKDDRRFDGLQESAQDFTGQFGVDKSEARDSESLQGDQPASGRESNKLESLLESINSHLEAIRRQQVEGAQQLDRRLTELEETFSISSGGGTLWG